ncbi:RNA polymerase sigma factor [Crocinitomix catalasitica]|uniref:RNA polymerase sigma factor n=1 Tax=Crocinitomix catalasitica TaxID=184607 RepID=UPI001B80D8D6|nr:sigma-70 family RNA polymerase sigma factor [Crocinitomix catalasitica]
MQEIKTKQKTMPTNSIYHHTEDKLLKELKWIQYAKEDPRGFEPLYNKYYEQILRYIYQRIDDKEMAFDITSQVFLKALNNIHKYEYRGVPFASWLYRIAKSELYQSFRDSKAKRTVNIDTVHLADMIDEMEEAGTDEDRKMLIHLIGELNDDEVQLIEMRYFEKRSFREIGEILEITENNAKVKSHRVLKKMKKLFNQIENEK